MFCRGEECLTLLATLPIGRVGVTMNALPVVLPVNFAVLDGDIVFRIVEGTKFHAAAVGTVVAFEVDSYDSDGTSGWSVVVQGASRVVTDLSELDRVRRLIVDPWAVDGSADRTVRITSTLISGRRFERHPSRPAPSGPARRPEAYPPPRRRRAAPDQGQED